MLFRSKNITEFLGDANIPSTDSLPALPGALPGVGTGPDSWKNRAASRFSGFFSSAAGAGGFGKVRRRAVELEGWVWFSDNVDFWTVGLMGT